MATQLLAPSSKTFKMHQGKRIHRHVARSEFSTKPWFNLRIIGGSSPTASWMFRGTTLQTACCEPAVSWLTHVSCRPSLQSKLLPQTGGRKWAVPRMYTRGAKQTMLELFIAAAVEVTLTEVPPLLWPLRL